MVLKGLPTAYNKDLQEDKRLLFASADALLPALQVSRGVLDTLQVMQGGWARGRRGELAF